MYIYEGPTIRLLRGVGGGMGDFRKNTPAHCFPTLKKKESFMAFYPGKNILHRCLLGKKFLAPEVWRKKSYPNQITHTPTQKLIGWPTTPGMT